ncbi:putative homing endonuclease [Pectobacterium phage DU_PP_I]|nr:putative homing endonuclease [Pectobacterium phage DU_PP_I]ATS93766.1 putative homing endonuclease [Pectobacterium phage DU_PP_IV]
MVVDLSELFLYDPNTESKIRHKVNRKRVKKGTEVPASKHSAGYHVCNVKGQTRFIHHIVWELHNGPIPEGMEVDHIDRVRDNNLIENLRLGSGSQNMGNSSGHSDKAGDLPKGVYKARNKFFGKIMHKGVTHKFSSYDVEEVKKWVIDKRVELFGEFALN